MDKLFYPALFHKAEEGGFWITFPDFPEAMTQGDDMEEAYTMAVDALGLCLSDMEKEHIPFPTPTSPDKMTIDTDSTLVLIEFDMLAYKKRTKDSIYPTVAERRVSGTQCQLFTGFTGCAS